MPLERYTFVLALDPPMREAAEAQVGRLDDRLLEVSGYLNTDHITQVSLDSDNDCTLRIRDGDTLKVTRDSVRLNPWAASVLPDV